MAIPEEFINEVKLQNDITDVIGGYIPLKRMGRNSKGLCPFHSEKTPSFTVYADTASFYCFGCQTGGDVIGFIRKIENLDYVEAIKFLAARASMTMPEQSFDSGLSKSKLKIFEQNRAAGKFFYQCLVDSGGREALSYLHQRGMTDSIIRKFGVGLAPDSWDKLCTHLSSLGYSPEEIELANLGFKNRYGKMTDRFRDRIMFPIIDLQGRVIAFGGRVYREGVKGGKYINTSDTLVYKKTDNLFAMNFAKNEKGDTIILCEGFMDVIAMYQAGISCAVASQGTAVTKEQARLIAKYAKRVIVAQDGDAAGQESIRRSIPLLKATGIEVCVLRIPGGENGAKDPDEYIRKFGKERFLALLESCQSDVEFLLDGIRKKHDTDTDAGKISFLKEACASLTNLSAIELDVYTSKLSKELSIEKEVIVNQVNINRKKRDTEAKKEQFRSMEKQISGRDDKINPERKNNLRAAVKEEELIAAIYSNADFARLAMEKLPAEKLVTSFNRKIYEAIISQTARGLLPSLSLMEDGFSDEERSAAARIVNSRPAVRVGRQDVEQCITDILAEGAKLTPDMAAAASDEELREYIEFLRRKNSAN
jgi:DNA primase